MRSQPPVCLNYPIISTFPILRLTLTGSRINPKYPTPISGIMIAPIISVNGKRSFSTYKHMSDRKQTLTLQNFEKLKIVFLNHF